MSWAFALVLFLALVFVVACSLCAFARRPLRAFIAGALSAECFFLLTIGWL